jgi:hypothetical protein
VICIDVGDHEMSLQVRKVYRLLEPIVGDPRSWLRVVDESGEDYLYPGKYFRALSLPKPIQRAISERNT